MRKSIYSPNTLFCFAYKTTDMVQQFNNPSCNIPSPEFFRNLSFLQHTIQRFLVNGYWGRGGSLPRVKQSRHKINHTPPSSTSAKNEWRCNYMTHTTLHLNYLTKKNGFMLHISHYTKMNVLLN